MVRVCGWGVCGSAGEGAFTITAGSLHFLVVDVAVASSMMCSVHQSSWRTRNGGERDGDMLKIKHTMVVHPRLHRLKY